MYEFYVTKLGYPVALTLLTDLKESDDDFALQVWADEELIKTDEFSDREKSVFFYPKRVGKYLVEVFRLNFEDIIINYTLDLSGFGNRFRLINRLSVLEPIW